MLYLFYHDLSLYNYTNTQNQKIFKSGDFGKIDTLPP